MMNGLAMLIACGCTLALTPLVRLAAIRLGALDYPGTRKIHSSVIPRLGGASVLLSCVGTIGIVILLGVELRFEAAFWKPVVCGGALVFLIGAWDDLRAVPAWVKLVCQVMAAGTAMWFGVLVDRVSAVGGGEVELGLLAMPITLLWIVGLTNAFNLIDGLDGLAAGVAAIAAGTMAAMFLLGGHSEEALLLMILAGSLIGFLRYNSNPATIFLGDSGSFLIGFSLAVMAVTRSQKGPAALAVLTPLLIFGLPILDVGLAIVRRLVKSLNGVNHDGNSFMDKLRCLKHIFKADQDHMHHRLLKLGLSHRQAVLVLYALAFGLAVLAQLSVLAHYRNAGLILLAVGLATYIGIRKLGYNELGFLKTNTLLRWYTPLFVGKLSFLGFLDLLLIGGAYGGAFLLKYDPMLPWYRPVGEWYANAFPLVLSLQLAVFILMGLYRGAWQAMGLGDLIRVSAAVIVAAGVSCIVGMVSAPPGVLAFFIIDMLLLGVMVLGARSSIRILHYVANRESVSGDNTVIYGAGEGGQLILRELHQNPVHKLKPIGFVDDNPVLHGCTIDRMPVLGGSGELTAILDALSVRCVVVSSTKIPPAKIRDVIAVCRALSVRVLSGEMRLALIPTDKMSQEADAASGAESAAPDDRVSTKAAPAPLGSTRQISAAPAPKTQQH
ncbi:MAG: hypothetical protein FJY37_02800 [Betaproteobacteria bacterium]|nr:hypothetical protein [Betaproteobacteria bacterium]